MTAYDLGNTARPLNLAVSRGRFPVDDWSPPDDTLPFAEWSSLRHEVLLKGSLLVIVTDRDGSPRAGERVTVRGCGFV